jgi:hypothetical protein
VTNPNIKLIITIADTDSGMARFTLHKGAQLDAGIISPKRLIEMHLGIRSATDMEDRISSHILKSVMGECTQDITGKCSLDEAVELIRALNYKQDIKLLLCSQPAM